MDEDVEERRASPAAPGGASRVRGAGSPPSLAGRSSEPGGPPPPTGEPAPSALDPRPARRPYPRLVDVVAAQPARPLARRWLDVPYSEKDEAKALGARWDPQARRWYAPTPAVGAATGRWAALPDLPDPLPGEDRAFGQGLYVDLVPDTCWFTNARSCVSARDWERLRRLVIGRAGRRCEVCGSAPYPPLPGGDEVARRRPVADARPSGDPPPGGERPGPRRPPSFERYLEVHERWEYREERVSAPGSAGAARSARGGSEGRPPRARRTVRRRTQVLKRLVCLCAGCHELTHYGLATLHGADRRAHAHLRAVTGMTIKEADAHIAEAYAVWSRRCRHDWELDLGILTAAGIAVRPPPSAPERAEIAERALWPTPRREEAHEA